MQRTRSRTSAAYENLPQSHRGKRRAADRERARESRRAYKRDGLSSWRGSCVLPYAGLSLPEQLRMTLSDGRTGEALVRRTRIESGSKGLAIYFYGNGPLE